jgi:hypothetical protein
VSPSWQRGLNNFSGTLGGGPWLRTGRSSSFQKLPPAAEPDPNGPGRGTGFTEALLRLCKTVNSPVQCLYDPATTVETSPGVFSRTPFATPVIPANSIDPLAKFYLDSIPAANYVDPLSNCGDLCNNYLGAVGSGMTTHNASVKIDHNAATAPVLLILALIL